MRLWSHQWYLIWRYPHLGNPKQSRTGPRLSLNTCALLLEEHTTQIKAVLASLNAIGCSIGCNCAIKPESHPASKDLRRRRPCLVYCMVKQRGENSKRIGHSTPLTTSMIKIREITRMWKDSTLNLIHLLLQLRWHPHQCNKYWRICHVLNPISHPSRHHSSSPACDTLSKPMPNWMWRLGMCRAWTW